MKNKKGVSVLVLVFFLIALLVASRFENNKLTKSKEVNIYVTDSLLSEIRKQDSLITIISGLEDSLLQRKTDTIIKITEVYEKRITDINNLTIDEQVDLLSTNLSENN